MDAAYLGRDEILALLLASGADRERRNKRGHSALDKALSEGRAKAVMLLSADRDGSGATDRTAAGDGHDSSGAADTSGSAS